MAFLERFYTLGLALPYHKTSTFFSSDLVASSIFILLLSIPLLLLHQLVLIPSRTKSTTTSPTTTTTTTTQTTPLWLRLLLLLDPALEYPLIFTFHPAILAYSNSTSSASAKIPPSNISTFPTPHQLILQILIFIAVELLFQTCISRNINLQPEEDELNNSIHGGIDLKNSYRLNPAAGNMKPPRIIINAPSPPITNNTAASNPNIRVIDDTAMISMEQDDRAAERLVIDFVRPRGTLFLAVALLGIRGTALEQWTGRLHPLAMVLWMAVRQIVEVAEWEEFGKVGLGKMGLLGL